MISTLTSLKLRFYFYLKNHLFFLKTFTVSFHIILFFLKNFQLLHSKEMKMQKQSIFFK